MTERGGEHEERHEPLPDDEDDAELVPDEEPEYRDVHGPKKPGTKP